MSRLLSDRRAWTPLPLKKIPGSAHAAAYHTVGSRKQEFLTPVDLGRHAFQGGKACLKTNVRSCGDVVNAFLWKKNPKREHLQIA